MRAILLILAVACGLQAAAVNISAVRVIGSAVNNTAIARNGSCSVTGTSCTFSGTATNSIKIVFAYRTGSTTPPTLPGTYTNIANGTAGTGSYRIGCNASSSAGDTGTGTWTNATSVAGLSYSGPRTGITTANCSTQVIGSVATSTASASTTASYPTITPLFINSSSWVAGFMGGSASSTCAPTGMSSVSATGTILAADTNAAVNTWATTTCAVSSEVWVTYVAEVIATNSSSCGAIASCNGQVLEVDTSNSVGAGGTYSNFGLSQATNNNTCPATPQQTGTASIQLLVTSTGFDITGSVVSRKRIVCGAHQLRQPFNNAVTNDEFNNGSTTMTFRIALSEPIFSSDTIVLNADIISFYTDGGGNTLAKGTAGASGASVTNNSTLAISTVRALYADSLPGWSRITSTNLTVRGVCFSHFANNGLPCAAVIFTATDAHAHTYSKTITVPTIDSAQPDQEKVIEYVATLDLTGFTNHDLITVTRKAYPWIGDSTAIVDTSDGTNSQPTPLYAPQYYVLDTTNNYSAAALVDGSATFTGSHTSGTFVAGEKVTQSTSGATAFLIDVTGANGAGPIHVGAVLTGAFSATNGLTWTGGTSGAVYTQTAGAVFAGADTNACAVAESTWPASPPPCRTINGGAVKMAAFNNASSTPTHNDACGPIYLVDGYYNWTGAAVSVSNTTGNCWATITPNSGASHKANVIIQGQSGNQAFGNGTPCLSGTTGCGTPIHLQAITINVATAPVSVFDGITYLWVDNVNTTMNGTAPFYNVTEMYFTWGATPSISNGIGPFSTVQASVPLIRGVDLTGIGGIGPAYTMIGNINKTIGEIDLVTYKVGMGAPQVSMAIFAYNGMFRLAQATNPFYQYCLLASQSTPIGAVFAQNVFESNNSGTGNPALYLAADNGTAPSCPNVMIWDNVHTGARSNLGYNDSGAALFQRKTWASVGNLYDEFATKSDTFTTANTNRTGNWGWLYGQGARSDVNAQTAGMGASGSFQREFGGLYTYNPTTTCGATQPCTSGTNTTAFISYVNRASYDGSSAGSGNGDYRVKSNSPAVNLVPSGTAVLPYDFVGQIRNNSGWGSSGAYEQAIIQTQVFGW